MHGGYVPIKHAICMIIAAVLETQHVLWSCRKKTARINELLNIFIHKKSGTDQNTCAVELT